MHQRNIYKIPPNFAELAKKYPFLSPFLTLNSQGAPKINFKDHAALRALTKALLLEDFDLNVEIPEDVLVPTVPLRLNYILWLEDLLTYNNGFGKTGSQICGIDVGTGATAIYALLAAKKNQWKMIGSEIDPESVMIARSNVERNSLQPIIEIRHVRQSVLGEVLKSTAPNQFDFTMCNPPFFGSEEETDSNQKSRQPDRSEPSGAKTGTNSELVVAGGELEFVHQMIEDSKLYRSSVKIFTTMIGIKKHIKDLVAKLKCDSIHNFTTTEFVQGKTMRWGVAWSFDPKILLHPLPQISYTFENIPGCLNFENYIFTHLQSLNFKYLEWISLPQNGIDETINNESSQTLHFTCTENTWTGQRRKRREMQRLDKQLEEPPPAKLMKMTNEENSGTAPLAMECSSSQQSSTSAPTLLEGHVQVLREGPRGTIYMSLLAGSLGKDGLNQILTYLRNSYSRDAKNPATELHQLLNS